MVADFLVFHQVVDHVGPAERAGGGAVYQHHRNAALAVRLQRKQVILALGLRIVTTLVSRPDSSLVQPFPSTAISARTAVWSYSSGTV